MECDAVIVAGFGFRADAGVASLRAAMDLAQRGHPPVAALAAPRDKVDRLAPLAAMLDIPLIGVDSGSIGAISTPTRSRASLSARGTGSVAEAAALAAAGPGAHLLTPRHISPDRMATCALAIGPFTVEERLTP